jgi:hypothetical protein
MKDPKKRTLLYKFLVFVLPFLVLSVIITAVTLSWTSYTYFQKTISENYSNILKSSAGEIRLYMQNAQRDLEALALVISATKLDEWQKDIALTAFNHEATEFMSVSLISRQGKKVASTGWEKQDTAYSEKDLSLIHISEPTRQAEIAYAVFCL